MLISWFKEACHKRGLIPFCGMASSRLVWEKVEGLIFIQIDHLKWEAQSYKEYYTVPVRHAATPVALVCPTSITAAASLPMLYSSSIPYSSSAYIYGVGCCHTFRYVCINNISRTAKLGKSGLFGFQPAFEVFLIFLAIFPWDFHKLFELLRKY